tara:strand:+ start:122 stop:769 length:648 start_codon:yes stop_codon:yes gene_type:complete
MKIGVLISGRGSNLKALIESQENGTLGAEISTVISNVPKVMGLKIADEREIENHVVDHKNYRSRELFEDELTLILEAANINLICLAGFMRILTTNFIRKWENKIINIHPSLLPAFKGLNTHERAIESGAKFTGCTTHFVYPDLDGGPIIAQSVVPISQNDTVKTLSAKVLAEEHKLYPATVNLISRGLVKVQKSLVTIKLYSSPDISLVSPVIYD